MLKWRFRVFAVERRIGFGRRYFRLYAGGIYTRKLNLEFCGATEPPGNSIVAMIEA